MPAGKTYRYRRRRPSGRPAVRRKRRVYKQRQAYKPRQKITFMRKRQPFVETKKAFHINNSVTGEVANPLVIPTDVTAPRTRQWHNINISPLANFLFMGRGLGRDQYLGNDIFSKYLKQKIEIHLPSGNPPDTVAAGAGPENNRHFHRITQPIQLWVCWGWLKRPYAMTSRPTNEVDVGDVRTLIDEITDTGKELIGDFHERESITPADITSDFLTFRDKRKNIWMLKKKLLRSSNAPSSVKVPESNTSQEFYQTGFGATPGDDPGPGHPAHQMADFGDFSASLGYPNKLQTSISWKTQRKIRYYQNGATAGNGFAQDQWIPFSYVVCPHEFQSAASLATPALYRYGEGTDLRQFRDLVGEIKVAATQCHWFSDS